MMHARRYLLLTLMVLGAVLTACAGGSGSSGFDAFPESAAITQALDEQHCVERKGLMICPADETGRVAPSTSTPTPTATATPVTTEKPGRTATPTSTPPVTPTPTPSLPTAPPPAGSPTPTGTPHIDAGVDTTSPIPCAALDTSSVCSLLVPFAPQGFGPDAVFRVAVRSLEPNARWMIGAEPIPVGTASAPNFDATVAVQTSVHTPSAGVAVQIAILVFHPGAMIPAEVDELAESGADFAFVTTTLTVQPAADTSSLQNL